MADITKIDYEALKTAVSELEGIKTDLGTTLKSVKDDMDATANSQDTYLSREAETCKQQFNEMYSKWAQKFDAYVQEYIDFFNKASESYTQTGEAIDTNAKNLNSFIG